MIIQNVGLLGGNAGRSCRYIKLYCSLRVPVSPAPFCIHMNCVLLLLIPQCSNNSLNVSFTDSWDNLVQNYSQFKHAAHVCSFCYEMLVRNWIFTIFKNGKNYRTLHAASITLTHLHSNIPNSWNYLRQDRDMYP